jgi:hypothetical protein
MLGGVGDAHVGLAGQFLHGARRLDQQVQQLQTVWVGHSAGHAGEEMIELFFVLASSIAGEI